MPRIIVVADSDPHAGLLILEEPVDSAVLDDETSAMGFLDRLSRALSDAAALEVAALARLTAGRESEDRTGKTT